MSVNMFFLKGEERKKKRQTGVAYYVGQRHGDKTSTEDNNGFLTEIGKRQVTISNSVHFANQRFEAFYSSEMIRAIETAQLAIEVRTNVKLQAQIMPELGYRWLEEDTNVPQFPSGVLDDCQTVFDCMQKWPTCIGFRANVAQGILRKARRFLSNTEPAYLYGASHSPLIEMAAPNPRLFPKLKAADIVCYEIGFFETEAYILDAKHYPCPSVD